MLSNMREFRVRLPDHLLPVQAYLNVWPDADILPMMERMSQGTESVYNEIGWSWWGGEDEDLPPSGKVLFFCGAEEVIVTAEEALAHLESAVRAFLADHPYEAASRTRNSLMFDSIYVSSLGQQWVGPGCRSLRNCADARWSAYRAQADIRRRGLRSRRQQPGRVEMRH